MTLMVRTFQPLAKARKSRLSETALGLGTTAPSTGAAEAELTEVSLRFYTRLSDRFFQVNFFTFLFELRIYSLGSAR